MNNPRELEILLNNRAVQQRRLTDPAYAGFEGELEADIEQIDARIAELSAPPGCPCHE